MATLGEYLGAGSGTTKLLLHLNGDANDSSGNGNNGTSTNITYSQTNGKFGQGAGFDGSSSKIVWLNNAVFQGNGSHTMVAWINMDSNPASGKAMCFVTKDRGYFGMFLRAENLSGTTLLKTSVVTTSPSTVMYTVNGPAPSFGVWYNLIGVFDNSAHTLTLYINGSQYGSPTTTGTTMRVFNEGCSVGSFSDTQTDYMDGKIDEVIIENRAWTPEEVKKYYTMTKGRYATL